ncbi:MAG: TatD family hydrolase [Patescibacteria group bacterium]|nr:TatD family hydrolase [Patescibacteria group bacterium]
MLIDTHAHLNFVAFDKDREKVIKKCLDNDIWVINVGTNFQTSKKATEVAKSYPEGMFASIGLHPINLDTGLVKRKIDELEGKSFENEFDYDRYKDLAESKKVLAIGEIGLDYYWKPKTAKKKELFKQKQKELLFKQLTLAKELGLPVIFHCRVAHQDLTTFLLENLDIKPEKAVIHSFVGNVDELQKYLDFGFYIGFNGIIFKNIEGINFKENIKKTPLNRILTETDSPYLIPPGVESERNEPLFIEYIAKEIAETKNIDYDKMAEITTENAQKLFSL